MQLGPVRCDRRELAEPSQRFGAHVAGQRTGSPSAAAISARARPAGRESGNGLAWTAMAVSVSRMAGHGAEPQCRPGPCRMAGCARRRSRGGAGGRTRTDTLLPEPDFESGASTNSATPARSHRGESTPSAPTSQARAERGPPGCRAGANRLHWAARATILSGYGRAGSDDAQCIAGPGRFTTGPAGIKPEERLPGRRNRSTDRAVLAHASGRFLARLLDRP